MNVDIAAVNDDPTNARSLPADISVIEDVSSNVDLSAIDFADVDASGGSLTVTLTTSTGGNLSGAAGTGITLGGNPTALTLRGTLADLNTYLNTPSNITYLHSTPHINGDNADTIRVEINDNGNTGSGGGTNITLGTVNVDIAAVNDAPVESTIEGSNLAYTENDGPVAVTSSLSISDVDDTHIESSVVQITGNYISGEDVLAFTDQLGITGSWDAGTGTLSLSGSAPLADYETALRSITYENTSDNPSVLARTVSFTVNDGDLDSNTLTRDIDIAAVNDAPIESTIAASQLAYTENEGPVTITSTLSIRDVDDTNIEYRVGRGANDR